MLKYLRDLFPKSNLQLLIEKCPLLKEHTFVKVRFGVGSLGEEKVEFATLDRATFVVLSDSGNDKVSCSQTGFVRLIHYCTFETPCELYLPDLVNQISTNSLPRDVYRQVLRLQSERQITQALA